MANSRALARILAPAVAALAVGGAALGGAAVASADTPVPPGSPGDTNGNGLLDSSERPDNPDL